MKYNNKEYNQKEAYEYLNKKILSSKKYYDFLIYLTKLNEFSEAFTFKNNEFDSEYAGDAIGNLDVMRYVCNDETGIKREREFHQCIVNAVSDENSISSIINTHLMEVKYGDPERKDDFTPVDKLYIILESIFGLDSILLSVRNKDILLKRFKQITNFDKSYKAEDLVGIIDELYACKDNEDEFENLLEANTDALKPYVSAGLEEQVSEITRDPNGNFGNYDVLQEMISTDVFKINVNKKM